MAATCNICVKRVLAHAHQLKCDACKNSVHIKCLPYVTKNDSIYIEREEEVWFCKKCIQSVLPFNHFDDDDELMEAIFDTLPNGTSVPFSVLQAQDKLFSPFELNEDVTLPLFDVDPDMHYYNSMCNPVLQNCDYYLEDMFNKKVSSLNVNNKTFSMVHTNIRSIPRNLNRFDCFLQGLTHEFPIIGISETWLKDHNKDLYGLTDYNAEHNIRPNRTGGGVSMFI